MWPADAIRLLGQVVDRPCNENRFYPALTWLSCSQRYYQTPEAGTWPAMQWKPVLSCTDLTFMQPTDITRLLRQVVWPDMQWKPVLSRTDLTFMQPSDIIGLLRQVVDDTGNVERAASLCIDVAVSQYFRVWLCNQNSYRYNNIFSYFYSPNGCAVYQCSGCVTFWYGSGCVRKSSVTFRMQKIFFFIFLMF